MNKKKIKLGTKVRLPRNYTFGNRKFKVIRIYRNGDLVLCFLGGREKGDIISRYGQEEVEICEK